MQNCTEHELSIFAGFYLKNEQSFLVHRLIHRFLAGEITAQEAIVRIREHLQIVHEHTGLSG